MEAYGKYSEKSPTLNCFNMLICIILFNEDDVFSRFQTAVIESEIIVVGKNICTFYVLYIRHRYFKHFIRVYCMQSKGLEAYRRGTVSASAIYKIK